jgi:hypothetical protein
MEPRRSIGKMFRFCSDSMHSTHTQTHVPYLGLFFAPSAVWSSHAKSGPPPLHCEQRSCSIVGILKKTMQSTRDSRRIQNAQFSLLYRFLWLERVHEVTVGDSKFDLCYRGSQRSFKDWPAHFYHPLRVVRIGFRNNRVQNTYSIPCKTALYCKV